MPTTAFRPSLHGWPFVNLFRYAMDFKVTGRDVALEMGFCGGMCWLALEHFSKGRPIARDIPAPGQDDPLYRRLLEVQVKSLPPPTVARIYAWQTRPEITSRLGRAGVGAGTTEEWEELQSLIDGGSPATITLLESCGDPNPAHLQNNHRVAAWGYEMRPLREDDEIHGERRPGIRTVVVNIYDPNFPNDDEVTLTFYLGCDDDWIGLSHNRGSSACGFFVDHAKAELLQEA